MKYFHIIFLVSILSISRIGQCCPVLLPVAFIHVSIFFCFLMYNINYLHCIHCLWCIFPPCLLWPYLSFLSLFFLMRFEHYCACVDPILCIVLDYWLSFEYSVFWNGCYDLNFDAHILLLSLVVKSYCGPLLGCLFEIAIVSLLHFVIRPFAIFEFFDNRKGSFFIFLGQLD